MSLWAAAALAIGIAVGLGWLGDGIHYGLKALASAIREGDWD